MSAAPAPDRTVEAQLRGVATAMTVVALWLGSVVSLNACAGWLPMWLWPLGTLWVTFLSTGLFITAHDAMHGTVAPRSRALNDTLGALAVGLYAAFWYPSLRARHMEHHDHVATEHDPDYHRGNSSVGAWFAGFVRRYVTWSQVAVMAIAFNVAVHVLDLPQLPLLAFWILPALLSTVQLFVFGTWLPHRGEHAHDDPLRARSSSFRPWLSLLACYHFDYHREHHAYPYVPWWRLPEARWNTSSR